MSRDTDTPQITRGPAPTGVLPSVLLLALALALALALVLGLTEPPAAPAAPVKPATPLPRLPGVPAAQDGSDALALLATTTMWGPRPVAGAAAAAAASAASAPVSRWRVSGTLWRQGEWRLVLQDDARLAPAQTLAAGDALPDGRRVLEVRRGGVRLGAPPAARRTRPRPPAEEWVDVPARSPAS